MDRRHALLLLATGVGASGALWALLVGGGERAPLRVGVLHSLTGPMAMSEAAVRDATLLAVAALNERGGLLGGRRVEAVVADGASDADTFAREAERLISDEGVCALFGTWCSPSRKAVRAVVERHDHLLFYPAPHEGLETSPAIVYTGGAPNQQMIPALKWALDRLGGEVFLVGPDQILGHAATALITDHVSALHGVVVDEVYVGMAPGAAAMERLILRLQGTRPPVILNTLAGEPNRAFFTALRAAGITPSTIPTLSFAVSETEIQALGPATMAGDYAVWGYFQSIDTPENAAFVTRFRAAYGEGRVVGAPMEAAWTGVHLWAQAVAAAGTEAPRPVRLALRNQSINAPQGVIYVDPDTQHTWKTVRVGRIRPDGQFDVVWNSGRAVRPAPYPTAHRTREDWDEFQSRLHASWNGQWINPASSSTETR